MEQICLKDIKVAAEKLSSVVLRTQLEHSRNCSEVTGSETYLKYENLQRTGSFKIRGALNRLLGLTDEQKQHGVIAASAGNHAQGVALGGAHLGIQSRVVMPTHTPIVKVSATQRYGAEVILHGDVFDESYHHAIELSEKHGYTFVHPFADPAIIAGQGTLGIEVLEQTTDLDSIVLPVGGGGLISGVAVAIKELKPDCKVYGVVPKNCSAMKAMFDGKSTSQYPYSLSIADGTVVKTPSPEIYEQYIEKYVDDIISVDEDAIASSIVFLLERAKTVVEGSGALVLAGAMSGSLDLGKKTCLVLSGGNVDLNIISKVIERGLSHSGRIARLYVVVDDAPGNLFKLTDIIATQSANILDVKHDRLGSHIQLHQTEVQFLLETRSEDHLKNILNVLRETGAKVRTSLVP